MGDFIAVANFNFIHELYPIKIELEHAGIECFIKDEYTVQANPFLSAAIGGIKLQVKTSDHEAAIVVLKQIGYLKDEMDPLIAQPASNFDKYASKLPFLNKLGAGERVLAIVVLSIIAVFILLQFI